MQLYLSQSINEILVIIVQNKMLKVGTNSVSKMIIFPQKPSLDTALCSLEIKENRVINIRYSPAEYECKTYNAAKILTAIGASIDNTKPLTMACGINSLPQACLTMGKVTSMAVAPAEEIAERG